MNSKRKEEFEEFWDTLLPKFQAGDKVRWIGYGWEGEVLNIFWREETDPPSLLSLVWKKGMYAAIRDPTGGLHYAHFKELELLERKTS